MLARMDAREQLTRMGEGFHGHRLESVVRGYVLEHLRRGQGLLVLSPRKRTNKQVLRAFFVSREYSAVVVTIRLPRRNPTTRTSESDNACRN